MKWLLALGGAVAIFLAIAVLRAKRAAAATFETVGEPPPPPGGWGQPPPPQVMDPTASRTGGLNPTDLCKRAYGAGTASVQVGAQYAKVPAPVNAGVTAAYNAVGAINCGAVNLIEKGVSKVIVAPAKAAVSGLKAVGSAIVSIF